MTYEMDQHPRRLQQQQQQQQQHRLQLNLAVQSPENHKELPLDSTKRNTSVHLSNLLHPESGADLNNRNIVFSPVNSIATPPSVYHQQQHQQLQAQMQQHQQQQQQQQPLSPFNVEQNMSYTRGEFSPGQPMSRSFLSKGISEAENTPDTQGSAPPLEKTASSVTDEDERFLRLAREALVATALTGRVIVDPTIQDLLQRLQYASSPHGNPIKHSGDIRANEYGQLMIQGFYRSFPNLSNDIFTGSPSASPTSQYQLLLQQQQHQHQQQSHNSEIHHQQDDANISNNHPSNIHNDGWNFLLDESDLLNANRQQQHQNQHSNRILQQELKQMQSLRHRFDEDGGLDHDGDDDDEGDLDSEGSASLLGGGNDSSGETGRTFICQDCQMSFKRSSDLKRHEKQHLKIPPNICELCGKGFARKDALKRHLGTLTCKRNADKKAYVENLKYVKK